MARRTEARVAFEALTIEGGLLSAEWLAHVAQLKASRQDAADYRVRKGLSLRDEIGSDWRVAQAHWDEFARGRDRADGKALAESFVPALLREAFHFQSLVPVAPITLDGREYPVGFAALGGAVPVVVAPAGSGLDTLSTAFGDGGRRRSAFGLCQEYLNAAERATWGLVCDGVTLRVVRDNASLTRPAWIEADLGRIFTEERYADFAALWLLVHETRFEGVLEAWREAGREQGTRAREQLRDGVRDALLALGQGFLDHPDNRPLREALHDGTLSTTAFFQQLLRLVYRLIFLLTVEERGLLHPDGAAPEARALYAGGYGLRRLRERSIRRGAHDRFSDLWAALRIVLRGLEAGEPRLGLPALAGLFARSRCPELDTSKLENRALLLAVFRLSWLKEKTGLSRVNWRDMGPEELGSVYESLLELVPRIGQDGRRFSFAEGDETKGNARKTTGSYYTPDGLVQVLLDTALEPVVQQTIAENPADPAGALLKLAIVDPACGSGHFLLAAARRLAAHVARLRSAGTPSAAEYRHALRQVVGRCIHGVDLNPMAVELCQVSLWMEAVEPGLPLGFLDAHVQHGNALLGTTPELMAGGVPDEAWSPIEGDDKKVASALKKQNKAGSKQQGMGTLWGRPGRGENLGQALAELDAAPDDDVAALARKEARFDEIRSSPAYRHEKLVADAWCAAFVWPKVPGPLSAAAPVNEVWRAIRDRVGSPSELTVQTVEELAAQYTFFHWHLAFPQVFARGGFDVVLGNPPWERVKLQEQEFFASRSEEIASAPKAADRKKLIAALPQTNPALWDAWSAASREAEGQSAFVRQSGRYPLCGKGDVNTYALFAEHNRSMLGARGRAGFIVPTGIATDDTTKEYFRALVAANTLRTLYDFQASPGLFGDIGHAKFKFSLVTLGVGNAPVDLVFFVRDLSELSEQGRHFSLAPADFALLNPNTGTCPTFRSRRDASLNLAIYSQAGVAIDDSSASGNPWGFEIISRLFHMAEDSELFRSAADAAIMACLPLVEAKMFHHFDHRYGDYAKKDEAKTDTSLPEVPLSLLQMAEYHTTPRYWVETTEVTSRLSKRWNKGWLLGWRDITNSVNERTVIAGVLPRCAAAHTTPLLFPKAKPELVAALYADLCSFLLDYTARQKVGGTHLTYSYLKQLPVLPPSTYAAPTTWAQSLPLVDWLLPRVLELTYTAWDLEPFANDVGWDGPPFRWDPERRFLLRAELDAAFFHLYGLSADDAAYVMDTFPIVQKNDEKAHGEYRTKRVILERFAAMEQAARTGGAYQTPLDPPPAADDPRIVHPPREEGEAEVIPFPTRPAPQPAWGPDLLPAVAAQVGVGQTQGSWSAPLPDALLLQFGLAGVLSAADRPLPKEEVERALIEVIWSARMLSRLDRASAARWRKWLGEDLKRPNRPLNASWHEVFHKAATQDFLQIDPSTGLWSAGPAIADARHPALEARAAVALAWMAAHPEVAASLDDRKVLLA